MLGRHGAALPGARPGGTRTSLPIHPSLWHTLPCSCGSSLCRTGKGEKHLNTSTSESSMMYWGRSGRAS